MKQRLALSAVVFATLVTGCATQNWYEGVRENQRQQCRQNYRDALAQQQCIDKVNSTSYQQYQEERQSGSGESK